MNGRKLLIAGLLGINAILVAGLLIRGGWQSPAANAQVMGGGHYLMVSGSDSMAGYVYIYNEDTGIVTARVAPTNNPAGTHWLAPYSISSDIKRARMQMR